jgi:hypothetical protein
MVCTVNHPNAPLLHRFEEADSFRWLLQHVPTFDPLFVETASTAPVLAAEGVAQVQHSAGDVLQVLTKNSREV